MRGNIMATMPTTHTRRKLAANAAVGSPIAIMPSEPEPRSVATQARALSATTEEAIVSRVGSTRRPRNRTPSGAWPTAAATMPLDSRTPDGRLAGDLEVRPVAVLAGVVELEVVVLERAVRGFPHAHRADGRAERVVLHADGRLLVPAEDRLQLEAQ